MPKTYLRYSHASSTGVIASPACNVVVDSAGRLCFTGQLENVGVWSVGSGVETQKFKAETKVGEATRLALRPNEKHLAVGHFSGRIHLWDTHEGTRVSTLNGHSAAVSALAFNASGDLLASGSMDTHAIVWDVVSETGLYRLRGHRNAVTDVRFLHGDARLLTSSKDTFLKVWELDTQHCTQTVVGHRSEVWTFDVDPSESRLVTGSGDNQLRVWKVAAADDVKPLLATSSDPKSSEDKDKDKDTSGTGFALSSAHAPAPSESLVLDQFGSILRMSGQRAVTVRYSPDGYFVACHGAGKAVEVYRVRRPEEVKKRLQRRRKRQREKAKSKSHKSKSKKKGGDDGAGAGAAPTPDEPEDTVIPMDELELWAYVTTSAKVVSLAFAGSSLAKGPVNLILALNNNQVETYTLTPGEAEMGKAAPKLNRALALQGHRADIRFVVASSDGSMVLTTAAGSTKLWNVRTQACIRTMDSGFGLCCGFGPGDRHAIVGTKEGALQLFDLASGDLVEEHKDAHDGAVWSLDIRPDARGLVTGSTDAMVKFWDFDLAVPAGSASGRTKTLTLVHTRTLKMTDDVLCVRYSHHTDPSKLLLAVALLDTSVKVFYEDSLKFFLSLYGHKLPVASIDISTDNTLIATASSDKNVKLWGLDFGDCHKSLFAHDDNVTCVRFIPRTHLFFTASKDKTIKYWDGDRFQHVLTLEGHKAEVWCLAVAPSGASLYSGSRDRSLRAWEKTDDIVFLEEEQEARLEAVLEKGIEEEETVQVAETDESSAAGKRTADTIKATDNLIEALEYADDEYEKWQEYILDADSAEADRKRARDAGAGAGAGAKLSHPPKNPLFLGLTPSMYVLRALTSIRPTELEPTLHALPVANALQLIKHLHHLLRRGLASELATKCATFLLRLHQKQVASTGSLRAALSSLRHFAQQRLQEHKDRVGFNLAALRFHQRKIDEEVASRPGADMAPVAPKAFDLGHRKNLTLL